VGGSDDVEYALRAALMAPMAFERSSCCGGVAGTDIASELGGAVSLRRLCDGWLLKKMGRKKSSAGADR